MPRNSETVTIGAEGGRDKDKVFLLTEMPAIQAFRWAERALLALAKSGMELPDNIREGGLAGFAALFRADGFVRALLRVDFADLDPLQDELMGCVQVKPSPAVTRALQLRGDVNDDIEEVATLPRLMMEVIGLHINFSKAGEASTS